MQAFWPVGTMVVTRCELRDGHGNVLRPKGAAGRLVKLPPDPDHGYVVRFPDGEEVKLLRSQMERLKDVQREAASPLVADEVDLWKHVHYKVVVGSRAFGLSDENSDTDRRGFYIAPSLTVLSLCKPPEQLQRDETQEEYWEVEKFLNLALRANPNVLEVLHSPLVEYASVYGQLLRSQARIFLSKLVYQTYSRYVMSQYKKMAQDIRNHEGVRWKHAMHLLRLLMSGRVILTDGFVPVDVSAQRDQLLAVKRGELSWEQVEAWAKQLHREMEDAFAVTTLPEHPDYEAANKFLLTIRRELMPLWP